MVAISPDRDDFDYVASLTGDASWSADYMRQYLVKMERNEYLQSLTSTGHGYTGWLGLDVAPPTLLLKDLSSEHDPRCDCSRGLIGTVLNTATFLPGDANSDSLTRDSTGAVYQIPVSTSGGALNTVREVIVAGDSYNSLQLLKLRGIGPASKFKCFNIPVVKYLPGVGTNLQDHYEIVVQGQMAGNWSVLEGCTIRHVLARSVFAAMVVQLLVRRHTRDASPDGNYDESAFCGPVNFRSYFPGYSVNTTEEHNRWSWALLKSHPRNRAGTVILSADPRDVPNITFNYVSCAALLSLD
jgi:choline dehydrogenase